MTVSADAIDADGVRQTRNTTMVISVGNGNMLGNINADDVRQMRNNTAMARSSVVDAIWMALFISSLLPCWGID